MLDSKVSRTDIARAGARYGAGSLRGLTLFLLVLTVIMVSRPNVSLADEIPLRVSVQAFVKPEDERLRVLMRVPMDALGDISFPVRGQPGNLIFSEAGPAMEAAAESYVLRSIQFFEGETLLQDREIEALRISMPSNREFRNYETALDNVLSPPLDDNVNLYFLQGFLDVLVSYPIDSPESRFSVDPRLGGLGLETTTVLRYILPDGEERTFTYIGNPGTVYMDPSWYQAALNFVWLGFEHILEGTDHLLFLLCLLIPLRNVWALIPVVTSFTIAHSITLMAAAFGWVPSANWFPSMIEFLIALSIVYMALENIIGVNHRHRWMLTFGFGLVHGFGFSFLLTESMQFAGSHLVMSLLAFNIGVELGQILVLLVTVPFLYLLFRYVLSEKMGVILLSALVAHGAWHWMEDRYAEFSAYQVRMPAIDGAFFVGLMQWMTLLLVSAGIFWLMYELFNRYFDPETSALR